MVDVAPPVVDIMFIGVVGGEGVGVVDESSIGGVGRRGGGSNAKGVGFAN